MVRPMNSTLLIVPIIITMEMAILLAYPTLTTNVGGPQVECWCEGGNIPYSGLDTTDCYDNNANVHPLQTQYLNIIEETVLLIIVLLWFRRTTISKFIQWLSVGIC